MTVPQTHCPTCRMPLVADDVEAARYRPFCSKRCQVLDLAKWFNEEYRISSPAPPPEPPPQSAN